MKGTTVITVLGLVACGPNVRTTHLTPPRPPTPDNVEVSVSSVSVPECPFEELGLVTVRETLDAYGPALIETMKDEARLMGGHALVRLRDVPKLKGVGGHGLSATVVRFTESDCHR